MLVSPRWALLPALVAGWLLLANPVSAITPQVKDDGGFFSAGTVAKADQTIREIKQRFNKDLVIETYKTPKMGADEVKKMTKEARERYYENWAKTRAEELSVDGILVIITKEPGHVQVGVGPETRKRAFTLGNKDELGRLLLNKFKEKQYDEGLLQGVQFVRTTLANNTQAGAGRNTGAPVQNQPQHKGAVGGGLLGGIGGFLCIGLLILGVLWLVFGLIRAFSGMGARGGYGGGGYGPGGGYGGGGGGGFMSGIMGGLFGAVAGNWIYNSFLGGHNTGFGGGASSAYGSDPGQDMGSRSDDGRDFSSSGGDFGDSGDSGGGGSDFGGGGGDFGGGVGGGGGDFGGGGGGGDF